MDSKGQTQHYQIENIQAGAFIGKHLQNALQNAHVTSAISLLKLKASA
jgi:hypothetical protein